MTTILYISYDGMLEPLGQSQVLAYLCRLAQDHTIVLISYEKSTDWADGAGREKVKTAIAAAGIEWRPLRYHKRPSGLATAWDIIHGLAVAMWLAHGRKIDVIHARSYVPAVISLALKRLTGARFLFDMRGFWADERVDGGLWPPAGRLYLLAKWFERQFLQNADHVVSLTHAGIREIETFPYLQGRSPPMSVIPTCADLERFHPGVQNDSNCFVLGYVGSVRTWYMFDETVACFKQMLTISDRVRFLIINRGDHDYIQEKLASANVPMQSVEILSASHAEIPEHIRRMSAGVFFIKPIFSKQASAPTKLAEFLGCGIPCLSNAGVGDMAEVLRGHRVGVAIEAFDTPSLEAGLRELIALTNDPEIKERCTAAANRYFSLQRGVADYAAIYASLGAERTISSQPLETSAS